MTAQETAPLNHYLEPVIAYKKLIAVVAILAIGLGVAAGLTAPKSYASTTAVLVFPVDVDPTLALGADESRIDMATELRIATSQAVLTSASERLQIQSITVAPRDMADAVTASSPKESSILDITFEAPTASTAQAGANAIADSFLDFRSDLASSNKLAAEALINQRIAVLNEQLLGAGPATEASVKAELEAQQAALAGISTMTVDPTTVIDQALLPRNPQGLNLVQLLVGAIAGGLVLGVISAYAVAAVRPVDRSAGESRSATKSTKKAEEAAQTRTDEASDDVAVDAAIAVATTEQTDGSESSDGSGAGDGQLVDEAETVRQALADYESSAVTGTAATAIDATAAPEADSTASQQPEASVEPQSEVTVEPADHVVEPAADNAAAAPEEIAVDPQPEITVPPSAEVVEAAAELPTPGAGDDHQAPGQPEALPGSTLDAETAAQVAELDFHTLQSVQSNADERREVYTVQVPEEDRRELQASEPTHPALTATPDMDDLIEHLQTLGQVGPIVGLTLGEEGVGTSIAVAFDLADALQTLGAKVLIIDAALEDPMLNSLLSVDASPGLAEVLTGQTLLQDAVRSVGGLKGLDALTIGNFSDATVDAIVGAPFERLLAEAKVDYHSILIISGMASDTRTVPALAALSDGLIVGTTQNPGEQASSELCRQLAALPAPTLEFLSEMLVVERSDGSVVVGSASM